MLIDSEKLKQSVKGSIRPAFDVLSTGYNLGLKGAITIIELYEEAEQERLDYENRTQ